MEYIIPQFWKQQQGQLSSSCSTTFTVPDHASHNTKNIECNNKGKNPENISTPTKKDNHCTAPVVIIDDNDDTSSSSTYDMHDDDIFVPVPKKEKHMKCSDCNLMFARKFTLKRHMQTKDTLTSMYIKEESITNLYLYRVKYYELILILLTFPILCLIRISRVERTNRRKRGVFIHQENW